VAVGAVAGVGFWVGGLALATSYQRSETPLVRNLVFLLRHDTRVQQLLGDRVRSGFWFLGTFNEFKVRL
jgi:hypothetical protein